MPTSWQYPRWRRILMQATLWLALAATTAIAALLTHERRQAMAVALPQRITVGAVTLGLPADWEVARGADDGSAVVLLAREGSPGDDDDTPGSPRTLLVRLFPQDLGATSPEEFLHRSGLLHGALRGSDGSDDSPQTSPHTNPTDDTNARDCTIAGISGILVKVYRLSGLPGDEPRTATEQWFACGLLPGGRALVLQLDGPPSTDDQASGRLLKAIAAGTRVAPRHAPPAHPPVPAPTEPDERL